MKVKKLKLSFGAVEHNYEPIQTVEINLPIRREKFEKQRIGDITPPPPKKKGFTGRRPIKKN